MREYKKRDDRVRRLQPYHQRLALQAQPLRHLGRVLENQPLASLRRLRESPGLTDCDAAHEKPLVVASDGASVSLPAKLAATAGSTLAKQSADRAPAATSRRYSAADDFVVRAAAGVPPPLAKPAKSRGGGAR
eukprot:CAMPEP_0202735410 /NCGR_PEP_ID=MMETSP1388-20130828/374_1 /ASSEMBLY_ACC=CAM_ASM_000864 /TAXON_ID=37098 /ORGANISM="Isochrysis sp, Strain CCMP1244" /LENGTH=132 /DNA_ID=CAMNT_0049401843 /DNA_START=39 /DNA_END=434 /DNA_ORIENTATION=+